MSSRTPAHRPVRGSSLSIIATPVHDRTSAADELGGRRVSVVHDVHDLLVGFLGDATLAGDATVEVVLRTTAQIADGDERRFDLLTMRRAAVRHAVALAATGAVAADPEDVRDLAVFDLVERRGLDGPTTSRTAEVTRRDIQERRARVLQRLTRDGSSADEVILARADSPWRVAPPAVVDAVAEAVRSVGVETTPLRRVGRAAAAATIALAAIAAVGAGAAELVAHATTDVVVGEPVAFTPTPSTVAAEDVEDVPRVTADDLSGQLVLPGMDETADGG